MRRPAPTRVPTSAIAKMIWINRIAGESCGKRLLSEPADIVDQLIDLTVGKLLLESRHLALAVTDRVIDAFVRNAVLPFPGRQIACMFMSGVERSGPPVSAVTARTFVVVNRRRVERGRCRRTDVA